MISKVRGTQDLLDVTVRNFVVEQIKKHVKNYNFSEIDLPILEHTKLFSRSLGQETDVVSKEMYVFNTKKEDSICLRPELTASVMRAFIENHVEKKPWKVFSYGPMFRHERPQKGRWRQFYQFNLEIINSDSILQDAYFIKMLDSCFTYKLKQEDYVLKLNFLGCPKDRLKHKEELNEYLETIKNDICNTCKVRKEKNILRIFDCKNETCKNLFKNAPKLTDCLCSECQQEWETLQGTLQILSVSFINDPYLVRGLDYYNKTVFEFCAPDLGAQNAFCGGGRYSLGKELEQKNDYPSIGCAIGIGRLLMLSEKTKDKLSIPQEKALYLILPMSKDQQELAMLLSYELQINNFCTDILFQKTSMTNMMKKANKMGAKYVLILGEDEQKNGTVMVKNMQNGKSKTIKQADLVEYLQ